MMNPTAYGSKNGRGMQTLLSEKNWSLGYLHPLVGLLPPFWWFSKLASQYNISVLTILFVAGVATERPADWSWNKAPRPSVFWLLE
jgi:hypothetical protein